MRWVECMETILRGEDFEILGKTEDYILEAKVVFGDGNEYIVKPLNKNELEKR